MDKDAEIYFYTDISDVTCDGPPRVVGLLTTEQSVAIKTTDICDIGALAMETTIINTTQSKEILVPSVKVEFDRYKNYQNSGVSTLVIKVISAR